MIIGICDDNQKEHFYLMQLCNLYGVHNYLHYYSGKELLHTNTMPELLFLEIEIPDLGGIEIMRKLEPLPYSPYIIFYTSHIELTSDAFGKKVLGFLHKPMSARDIEKYLTRTQSLLAMEGFIIFEDNKKVYYNEILYVESSRNYTIFHHVKGNTTFSRITMTEWVDSLPACFSHIHRSYIVNFHHVSKLKNNHIILDNIDNETLPISRRRQKEVIQEYEVFLFQNKPM